MLLTNRMVELLPCGMIHPNVLSMGGIIQISTQALPLALTNKTCYDEI